MWRCAKCGRTVRTGGQVVAQRCGCSDTGNWMVLQPPVKREPFVPPAREPLFDPGAVDAPATAPAETASDQSCGAAVPAAEAQEPMLLPEVAKAAEQSPEETADLPVAALESAADSPAPAVDVPISPMEGAPAPAPAEPGGTEPEPGIAPPDDFGAGLGNG
jgi:hypothetical protein